MYSPLYYTNKPHKKTVSFSDNIQVQYFEKEPVLSSKKSASPFSFPLPFSIFSSSFFLFLFFLFSLFAFFLFYFWKRKFWEIFSLFPKNDFSTPIIYNPDIIQKIHHNNVSSDEIFEHLRV